MKTLNVKITYDPTKLSLETLLMQLRSIALRFGVEIEDTTPYDYFNASKEATKALKETK